MEFGVLERRRRRRRAGHDTAGARRRLRRDLPAAARRPPGAERRAARWPRSRRSSAPGRRPARSSVDTVRAAFAAVRSPGRLEPVRTAPDVLLDAAHNPAGMAADGRRDRRGVRLPPADRRRRDARRQGRHRRCSTCSSPCSTRSWSRRTAQSARLPVDELAAVAVEVFGADRVTVEPRLDDAHRGGRPAGRGQRRRRPRRLRRAGHRARWSPPARPARCSAGCAMTRPGAGTRAGRRTDRRSRSPNVPAAPTRRPAVARRGARASRP